MITSMFRKAMLGGSSYDILPNSAFLRVSDYASIAEQSASTLRFLRPVSSPAYLMQNASPGTRASFVTNATSLVISMYHNNLVNWSGNISYGPGVGAILVDGVEVQTYTCAEASIAEMITVNVALSAGTKTVTIVWPYWTGFELRGITTNAGATVSLAAARPTKKIAICGDSISQGYAGSKITTSWPYLLANLRNRQLINLANGGQVAVATDADGLDGTDADIVTYMIGYNNFVGQTPIGDASSGFQKAVQDWITKARTALPDATIYLITPIYSPNTNTIPLSSYRTAIVNAEAAVGDEKTYVLDGLQMMTNSNSLLYEGAFGVHPNDAGAADIATKVHAAMYMEMDFTRGVSDSRVTFSRADATPIAKYTSSTGVLTTVASAGDQRFDYDPISGSCRGLLIEKATTNLFIRSEEFDSGPWIRSNTTTTGTSIDAAKAPDDTDTADYVLESAVTAVRFLGRDTGLPGASTEIRTVSFYVKGGLSRQWVSLCAGNTSGGPYYRITADLSAGTISSTDLVNTGTWFATTPTNKISAAGKGWYRISITGRLCQYYLLSSNNASNPGNSGSDWGLGSFLGDTNNGFVVWGGQLEVGILSSYVKTTTATVTRAQDTALVTGTNFSNWYTGGTVGTFMASWYGSPLSASARSVIATSDQATKHLHMYQTASASTLRLADFGPATTVTTANSLTAGAVTKGAFSYNGTATSLCLNGGTVATGTLAFSVAPTWLSIGGASTNGTSITDTASLNNDAISTIEYYPNRLTNAQMQVLTT
jgi:lysophospholipase L1-like esterase